jgi:hypothetical protein
MSQTLTYYAALAIESAVGVFGIRLYEEPRYAVIDRIGSTIEIRRYAPRLAAEIAIPQAGNAARGDAFRTLFAYISGANRAAGSDNKIAMTAPVELREPQRIAMTAPVQTAETGSGGVSMKFFLPASFSRETAPAPTDTRVKIVSVPEETIAVLRFSGGGGDMPERQAELLRKLAKRSAWRPVGDAYGLYYDAPFTLPFLRRNEAAVAVTAG